jgi:superfamily II DNA/RNA helicase
MRLSRLLWCWQPHTKDHSMQTFSDVALPQALLTALVRMNFTTPTPIQAEAIPVALAGKDILGSAQTGTGKTGAFGIPLVARLLSQPTGGALVLTPTRELAVQVLEMLKNLLGARSPINTALLIGGEPMPRQFQQLRAKPRLVVGTPGRINDHLERGSLSLADASFLVLDETDRMLDMGFGVQLERIAKHLPTERQTLMFSATLPANIVKLSNKYLSDPVRIAVGSTTAPTARIKQEIIHTPETEKYTRLIVELERREGSIIVFVKTKWGAEKLAEKLNRQDHRADAIHGDLRQNKREKVIENFRNSKYRIMVATDIAARGLDIPHIAHVINYDLPQCPEDYIHRIGRTARAGAEGEAVNLITPQDGAKWRAIHRLMHPGAPMENDRGGHGERGPRTGEKPERRRFGGKPKPAGAPQTPAAGRKSAARGYERKGFKA